MIKTDEFNFSRYEDDDELTKQEKQFIDALVKKVMVTHYEKDFLLVHSGMHPMEINYMQYEWFNLEDWVNKNVATEKMR